MEDTKETGPKDNAQTINNNEILAVTSSFIPTSLIAGLLVSHNSLTNINVCFRKLIDMKTNPRNNSLKA